MRVIHFLNSYSHYPFQTNYFLLNKKEETVFNLLPPTLTNVLVNYESKVLLEDHEFKVKGKKFCWKGLKRNCARYNLKLRLGSNFYLLFHITLIFLLLRLYSTFEVDIYMKTLFVGQMIIKALVVLTSIMFFNYNDVF